MSAPTLPLSAAPSRLRALLAAKLRWHEDPRVDDFVAHFRQRHGDALDAVIFYGSRLLAETRTPGSFYDFYLLTAAPLRFYRNALQAALNLVLPPNIYFGTVRCTDGHVPYKCCVLTLAQFASQTSDRAADLHHLGRFSKRFAIAYARDQPTADALVDGALSAIRTLTPHALALLPERFDLEAFALQLLALSYLGERRVAEPTKVEDLFAGERDYYLDVFAETLRLHAERHGHPRLSGTHYENGSPGAIQRRRTERLLRRSRRRGAMRWPKYVLTVDNWLQIQIDKLERYHGVQLDLSPRQRRHPLIFGWPKFLELKRRGIIR